MGFMRSLRALLPLLVLFTASCSEPPAEPAPVEPKPDQSTQKVEDSDHVKERQFQLKDLERVAIEIDGKKLWVWVMDSNEKRAEGMMWLEKRHVQPDDGMLFVFPAPAELSFWMRNTLVGLDLAFIGPDGKILNVEKGLPLNEAGIPAAGKAQYVLEMLEGAFERNGIRAGMTVKIPKTVVAKD